MTAPPRIVVPVPDPALVVLVGPSGAGKSTFARRHFRPTEVVSSDACRAMIAGPGAGHAAPHDLMVTREYHDACPSRSATTSSAASRTN